MRSKDYTTKDVQAAHDALRPHVQRLVDRFGQAQASEILLALIGSVCPDGRDKLPRYLFVPREERDERASH